MKIMRPKATEFEVRFLYELLDREGDGKVDQIDFLDLREIQQLSLNPLKPTERSEKAASFQTIIEVCQKLLSSSKFEVFAKFLVVANTVISCLWWYVL